MISSVYNNISTLFAFSTKMGVIAGNPANVNTDEFKKSRADIVETSHGDVEAEVSRVDTPGAFPALCNWGLQFLSIFLRKIPISPIN